MEHRWGIRVRVDMPVRVTAHPFAVRTGRLCNLSVSGGFVKADFEPRPLSRIYLVIELPYRSKHDAPSISAYVARKFKDGFGVEWCEFAPPAITKLLQSLAARPYVRFRKPETAAAVTITRLSTPLLKHGT